MSYIEKIEDSSIVRIRHDIRDAFSILNADPYQDSTKKELEAAIHNKLWMFDHISLRKDDERQTRELVEFIAKQEIRYLQLEFYRDWKREQERSSESDQGGIL
tara:strand:- start:10819 stop:11127 length:309 start_codon:yes stop_codon:yes gene_type:complete